MKIRSGQIVPDTQMPLDEGVTAPFRCVVIVDGERFGAVAKAIPPANIERECVCAVVLRAWGISVPEPLLLEQPDGTVCFGSLDAEYPSLAKRLAITKDLPDEIEAVLVQLASAIICSWDDAPQALAADEIIENGDRNLGNFLWSGGKEHMYIDHERALGGAPFTSNHMVMYAQISGATEQMCRGAVDFARRLAPNLPRPAADHGLDFQWGIDRIRDRIAGSAQCILDRFPSPDDLFSQC